MNAEELIREFPKGLLNWYNFKQSEKILYIKSGETQKNETVARIDAAMEELFAEQGLQCSVRTAQELLEQNVRGEQFRYIVIVGAIERCKEPKKLLATLKAMLAEDGILLLGMDNRLGIRYFCGDRDPFTERSFDGIENYRCVGVNHNGNLNGRNYSKAEMAQMLEQAGFTNRHFYSVLQTLSMPQLIYAEDYLPEEELAIRCCPEYYYPGSVFLDERMLYSELIENGLFHTMSNAYLVECPLNGCFADVKHVTVSMNRGRERNLATVIRRDGCVEKRALYPEGRESLQKLMENTRDLQAHGIPVVDAWLEGDAYVMPYVKGEAAVKYFLRLLYTDVEQFLKELDYFQELILRSSGHVPYDEVDWEHFIPDWERRKADDPQLISLRADAQAGNVDKLGVILEKGYFELAAVNCFHTEDGFLFYDQEFCLENAPAKGILLRTISMIYASDVAAQQIYPQEKLMERYHLNAYKDIWSRWSSKFLDELVHNKELTGYQKMFRCDYNVVNSNRQRINYAEYEYQKLFRDIFDGTEGKQIYLFGSGRFAKKFLSEFGKDYKIAGILDNNAEKWGTHMQGIEIKNPECLKGCSPDSYKVIICIKNFVAVVNQLKQMGVISYGIYDGNLKYARPLRKQTPIVTKSPIDSAPKKYHTGYVAGVFDMFHKGHLNLLRRAKEQCEYLIVGVVTDESVRRNKGTNPVIPFEERLEIVAACRYVDEAVEIPTEYGDTDEAYRRYQFDVQFSGSDYENDPDWLAKQTFLRQRGSDLVFFPYTKSTSSTKLKEMISKKLL